MRIRLPWPVLLRAAGALLPALTAAVALWMRRDIAVAAKPPANARNAVAQQTAAAVERARHAEQRAWQAQRSAVLARLASSVAHDFNNLLGVISNSAHLIERHAARVPALQMPVDATLRAVAMGSHLSQELLRFSGCQPMSPRPVDLAVALPEWRDLLQMAVRKNVRLGIRVAPGTAPVKIDPGALELALITLALHARDALPQGGQFQVHARQAAMDEAAGLPAGAYVLLTVSDNGVGLPEDQVARVFEPFVSTQGVGDVKDLGLRQVHDLCAQAGGTARLTSTPGLGSTVTLVLPTCIVAAATPPSAAPAAGTDPCASLSGGTVLLVEDNDELAEMTALVLRSHGCQVKRAAQVDDAVWQIDTDDSLQLVLTDVAMPGARNGVDLARMLARTRPRLPVVLISGDSTALAGLTGFTVLRKPVGPDRLVRTLATALRGETPPAAADNV